MDRHITNVTTAIIKMAESKKSLVMHTSVLAVMAVFAIAIVAPQQAHHAWAGDYIGLTDFDPFAYELNRYAREVLNAFGHEHPSDVYRRENPHKHPDHPHHHSKLERFVEAHWKSWLLHTLISLNLFFLLNSLVKLYAVSFQLTFSSLLLIMWLTTMNGVGQFVALLISLYLVIVDNGVWDWISLFVAVTFFLSACISVYDLHTMRNITVYMSALASETMHHPDTKDDEFIGKMREEQRKNPHSMLDNILWFIHEFKVSITRHQLKAENHPKYE